ncbi:MAG: carboxypeptidase regulatory-like domain-containing protein [Euryarchaeota archaeon]|nr:carboxypeptidase regulatory-like domain-containing protein [Euryarchaeota archaeon]
MRLTLVAATLLLFGGCFGQSSAGPAGVEDTGGGALYIEGLVVDQEIVPVAAAVVVVKDRDGFMETDETGRFKVGPVEAGEHVVTVEKAGYATQTVTVRIDADPAPPLTITLTAVALDVPYQLTTNHVTFVICASRNPIGGVPCTKLADWAAGTNVSPDERFAYTFKVPNPGLKELLVEITWNPQSLGKDVEYWIQTPPGQALTVATLKYFGMSGGPPLRGWVQANAKNGNYQNVFDAEPNKITYEAVSGWSDGNGTIPPVRDPTTGNTILRGTTLFLNHRTESWLTYFYNREGSRAFSALPDG